ncbi:hypothetical protein KW800_02415 [Candidatus Parcubacteria bacterium]|nr:hypothetical protein [Candidatus Parcubacteria bacterium]
MNPERLNLNEENERKFALYAKIISRQLAETLNLKQDEESIKSFLISSLMGILPAGKDYAELTTELESLEVDESDALDLIVDTTIKFLASHFEAEDFGQRVGERFVDSLNLEPINQAIAYKLSGEHGSHLELHIPTVITDNPMELRTLVFQGLKKLAEELQSNEKLANVEKLTGATWIAKQYPRLAEALGFEIKQTGQIAAMVEISRDKFLERYGQK